MKTSETRSPSPEHRTGSILFSLIIIMTVIATLSAALVSMTGAGVISELMVTSTLKAHYLAESGQRCVASGVVANFDATFTLSDSNTFVLRSLSPSNVSITAIINPGSATEASRTLTAVPAGSFASSGSGSSFTGSGVVLTDGGAFSFEGTVLDGGK